MKYSKAQLNAISRSICERREKERKDYIFQNDLLEEYMSFKYKKRGLSYCMGNILEYVMVLV